MVACVNASALVAGMGDVHLLVVWNLTNAKARTISTQYRRRRIAGLHRIASPCCTGPACYIA
jgi:hypothetical protein